MYSDTSSSSAGTSAIPPLEGWDPREWIAAVWRHYLELFPKILGLQHAAAELAATTDPGTWVHDTARELVDGAAKLAKVHTATVAEVEKYSGYLGLGAGYLVPAAFVLAALAGIIAWSFRRYDALEATLQAVQAGAVTPEQANELLDSAGLAPDLSVLGGVGVGTLLGIGAAVALFLWAKGRRRSNPDLVLLGMNPDPVWSHRVLQLDYIHDDNGQPYTHTFRPGVRMQALEDGSVRLYNPRRRIWRDF